MQYDKRLASFDSDVRIRAGCKELRTSDSGCSRAFATRHRIPTMSEPPPSSSRRLVCARCGTAFECKPGGDCWCAAEPYRLPLSAAGAAEDCLCPACLRQAAAAPATSL